MIAPYIVKNILANNALCAMFYRGDFGYIALC